MLVICPETIISRRNPAATNGCTFTLRFANLHLTSYTH